MYNKFETFTIKSNEKVFNFASKLKKTLKTARNNISDKEICFQVSRRIIKCVPPKNQIHLKMLPYNSINNLIQIAQIILNKNNKQNTQNNCLQNNKNNNFKISAIKTQNKFRHKKTLCKHILVFERSNSYRYYFQYF